MEQILANGVYLGSQYAMIALGLTLIFALMNVLNFAHGQMYVIGGFVTYTFYGHWGVPFVLALVMSCVTLAILGALIERYLFAPVIKGSSREESTMLLAAGIAFFSMRSFYLFSVRNSAVSLRLLMACSTGISG